MDTKETNLYYLITTATLLLFVVMAGSFYCVFSFNKSYRALKLQKLNEDLMWLENEKFRIASDLHDQVGPIWAAIKMKMIDINPADELSASLRHQTLKLADDAMQMIRDYSSELIPLSLPQNGLIHTLQDTVEKVKIHFPHLKINFSYNNIPAMDEATMLTIFRIIQEIILNTLKHSRANVLHILFSYNNKDLIISTKDNGIGFKTGTTNKLKGLGLLIMQWHTERLQGRFHMRSTINRGTDFYIAIPYKTDCKSREQ